MEFQNDIIELSLIGTMQGQPVFNILHYVRESLGATPATAFDIAASWEQDFQNFWLGLHPDGYDLEAIRVQRIVRGDTMAISRLPPINNGIGLAGTRIGESNPACQHVWVSYLTAVVDPDIWFQGGSALAAGNEADITNGSISALLESDINSFYTLLFPPWTPSQGGTDDVLQWSIYSPSRQSSFQAPIAIMVEFATVRLNVSASERRRKGTSRGGFQP